MKIRRLAAAAATAGALIAGLPVTAGHAASTPRCKAGDLAASLVPGSPGAGQRYATLRLTNVGSGSCHLRGYPGAQLQRGSADVPTDIVRSPAAVHTVTLARGERAVSQWHWGAIASGDEPTTSACEPTADHIRITPPDAFRAHRIRWRLGEVCDHGRIEVQPMVPE